MKKNILFLLTFFVFLSSVSTQAHVQDSDPAYTMPEGTVLSPRTDINLRPNTTQTSIGSSNPDFLTYTLVPSGKSGNGVANGCFLVHQSTTHDRLIPKGTALTVGNVIQRSFRAPIPSIPEYTYDHRWTEFSLKTPSGKNLLAYCYREGVYWFRSESSIGLIKNYFDMNLPDTEIIN